MTENRGKEPAAAGVYKFLQPEVRYNVILPERNVRKNR